MPARNTLLLGIALAVLSAALVAGWSPSGMDYLAPSCVNTVCDDAGPSIEALSHGDLSTFFAQQPPMGSFSLLLRTPPAIVANTVGDGDLLVYQSGVFICALAAGLLALWLALDMMRRGRPWTVWALVAAAVVFNPLTFQASYWGHPEEVLAAVLVVGALIASGRRRWLIAGLMLGAAVATKQWAALAALPVLMAAPAGTRARLAVTCVALAGTLTLPMLVADPGRFRAAQEMVSSGSSYLHTVTATNLWWAFSTPSTDVGIDGFGQTTTVTQFSLPNDVGRLLHHGVIVLALVLPFLYARRRSPGLRNPDDLLQLVALVFLARCMLDPLTFSYHHVPFLIALLSFEALRRQLPVLSAYAIGALLLMNEVIVPTEEPWLINAFYLVWTIPLAAAMTLSLFSGRLAIGGLAGTPAEARRPARTALVKPA